MSCPIDGLKVFEQSSDTLSKFISRAEVAIFDEEKSKKVRVVELVEGEVRTIPRLPPLKPKTSINVILS